MAVRSAPVPRAAAAGALFFACLAVGVGGFAVVGLQGHLGLPRTAAFCIVGASLGIYGACCGALAFGAGALLRVVGRWPGSIAFITGWVTMELWRSSGWGLMPWNLLGTSQAPVPILLQTAELGGAPVVGALLVTVNALLAAAVSGDARVRRRALAGVVAVLGGALVFGGLRMRHLAGLERDAPTVRVGLAQGFLDGTGHAGSGERPEPARLRMLRLTLAADELGADVVLWPEVSGGPWPMRERGLYWSRARRAGRPILAGVMESVLETPGEPPLRYNAAVWDPGDRWPLPAPYRKRHLVPLAEYAPLDWDARRRDDPTRSPLRRGPQDPQVFRSGSWSVAPMICFEFLFADALRASADTGADWLAVLSNDGWYDRGSGPVQHHAQVALAAVATRRPIARSANTGISGAFDAAGRALPLRVRLWDEEAVAVAEAVATVRGTPRRRAAVAVAELPLAGAAPLAPVGSGWWLLGPLCALGLVFRAPPRGAIGWCRCRRDPAAT